MLFKVTPDYIHKHITDINLKELKESGIKGLILDLDNTIMAPKSGILTSDIEEWLKQVQIDFKIAIVSNNRKKNYLKNVADMIGCPVYGNANKPYSKIIVKTLNDLNLKPEEVAVIGDRPLTDIWVGNHLGSVTILVEPLIKDKENYFIKFLRKLERSFVNFTES